MSNYDWMYCQSDKEFRAAEFAHFMFGAVRGNWPYQCSEINRVERLAIGIKAMEVDEFTDWWQLFCAGGEL
jgi:hypothetical protein